MCLGVVGAFTTYHTVSLGACLLGRHYTREGIGYATGTFFLGRQRPE